MIILSSQNTLIQQTDISNSKQVLHLEVTGTTSEISLYRQFLETFENYVKDKGIDITSNFTEQAWKDTNMPQRQRRYKNNSLTEWELTVSTSWDSKYEYRW